MDSLKKQLANQYSTVQSQVDYLRKVINVDKTQLHGTDKNVNAVDNRYEMLIGLYHKAFKNPNTRISAYTSLQISDNKACKATYGDNKPETILHAMKAHSKKPLAKDVNINMLNQNSQHTLGKSFSPQAQFLTQGAGRYIENQRKHNKNSRTIPLRPMNTKQQNKEMEKKYKKGLQGLERD